MPAIANQTVVLASAVTNTSTVVVAYPTGMTQARLIGSTGGQLNHAGVTYPQAASGAGTFAITFGASDITITNNSGVTWAAQDQIIISYGDTSLSGSYDTSMRQAAPVALTAATGTASNTISDVGASFTQATLNNNFKSLADKVNAILALLKANGTTV